MMGKSLDEMLSTATEHMAMIQAIKRDIEENNKTISKKQADYDSVKHLSDITDIGLQFLKRIIKEESDKFISQVESIVNYGVKNIFTDEEYTVSIKTNEDKAELIISYTDKDGNFISHNIQQGSGGIRAVIGILIQVFFIYYLDVNPLLMIDEGFTEISDANMENLFIVLKELTKTQGLKLFLITHDDRVKEFADRYYKMENGEAILIESEVQNDRNQA